uniref:PLOD1-3-like GT domain-containing protein n=1 Tax=Alexandrium monilatum TaxID=311494 RepID=A0A6T0ZT14_9DINO
MAPLGAATKLVLRLALRLVLFLPWPACRAEGPDAHNLLRGRPPQLHLVTFMNKVHRMFAMLQTSAEAHGLYPKVIGYGRNAWWPSGLGVKINELRRFLWGRGVRRDDVVAFVDAFDVIVFADEDEILAAFADMERLHNASIFFNAERYCFPKTDGLCDDYPPSPTRWRHLNSGLIAGRVWALRQLLHDPVPDVIEGSDQAWYQRQFRSGNFSDLLALDRECRFLCAVSDADAVVLGPDARMVRRDTGYRPALVHWAGVGHWVSWPEGQDFPTSHLADMFRRLYPDVAKRLIDGWFLELEIGSTHDIKFYEGAGFWSVMELVLCVQCNVLGTTQRECEYFAGFLCRRCRLWSFLGLLFFLVVPLALCFSRRLLSCRYAMQCQPNKHPRFDE